jgi:hypothetical protein
MLLVSTCLVALQKSDAEQLAKIPFAYKRATGGLLRCNPLPGLWTMAVGN